MHFFVCVCQPKQQNYALTWKKKSGFTEAGEPRAFLFFFVYIVFYNLFLGELSTSI